MANISTDLLDYPVNAREQRAVLKLETLSTAFQQEIKAIYEKDAVLSQLSKERRYLTENAKKMIFGVDRAEIPSYFFTKNWTIEDERTTMPLYGESFSRSAFSFFIITFP
jgi:hypothetical protein